MQMSLLQNWGRCAQNSHYLSECFLGNTLGKIYPFLGSAMPHVLLKPFSGMG